MADFDISNMTSEAAHVAEKVAKEVGKQLRDFYDEKKHSAIEIKDDYETLIKNRPFSSVFIAFAIGFGVGFFLKRNK